MVDKTKKFLRKLPKREYMILEQTLVKVRADDLVGLQVKKLRGVNEYRVRKGKFRIRFVRGQDNKNVITKIGRRDKGTYRDL